MKKSQAEEFADYEVYEIVDGKYHCLCLCKEYDVAKSIAKTFARLDPACDTYYVSSVNYPGDFVPGGGWYDSWHWDKEKDKLVQHSLI